MNTIKSTWPAVLLMLLAMAACGTPTPSAPQEPTAGPPAGESPAAPAEEEPAEPAGRGPLVLEDGKLYLALIWHQHQPVYFKDPETGVYERPWVRVHATKDYLDMAATVAQYPNVHVTFNITPSLIRQLDDLAAGTKDLYQVYAEIPASELTVEQKTFILQRFFDTNARIIARFPRYQELAEKRGGASVEQIAAALDTWTEEDFRDLQVLFNLAWTDPDWLAEEPLASLVAKGRGFSEEDKAVLFAEHLRIVQEVIPYHADLQRTGQIEVTMTPFAHPILPLITDSNLAAVAMPDANLPTRYLWGQDASAQVELGVQFYQEHFGMAPRGMWPAEGSVAQQVVTMISSAGIRWIATDQDVLARSLPDLDDFTRDSRDVIQQADVLYRPYQVQGARGGPVAIIFRDKLISDKVGFEYSGTPGAEAAADFMQRMENIRARLEEEGAQGPHLVTVLLDGENAWEYYDNDGKEFLNELYRLLSASETVVTVTPSEYLDALAAAGQEPPLIPDLYPGSWIDGTFSTWIGEDEENMAWEYLGRMRTAVQDAVNAGLDEATLQQVMELVYIAEGSDWFWWYGADQNSGADDNFDRQFRSYLEQIYTLIGREVPDFVYVPVIPQTPQIADQEPLGLLAVTADGTVTAGEWDDAGYYALPSDPFTALYYGFDTANLYLRLDSAEEFAALGDLTIGFYLNTPQGTRTNAYTRSGETQPGFGVKQLIEVTFTDGVPTATVYKADGVGGWELFDDDAPTLEAVAVQGGLLEIAAPFASFAPNARTGDRINLRVVVSRGGQDTQVIPASGPTLATVPELPIPNVVAELTDPLEDDYGPGAYVYPTDGVFKPGVFDIAGFVVGYDDQDVIFRIDMRGPVINEWGSPNGMSVQTVDIYIDVDGPGSGARLLLPGRNAALTADHAWDYAIWAEGWTPGIYTPGDEGPVQISTMPTILTNPGQRRITVRVPLGTIAGDPADWAIAVVVLGQEGYPSSGVWRVRDVEASRAQWRFGGAGGQINETRILDVLWPGVGEGAQEDFLTAPPVPAGVALDELTPDDFPQVPSLTLR
ncbi:MAG: glucodextranase DOMON-like domain-containing protein [Anaerolineae bacterium]